MTGDIHKGERREPEGAMRCRLVISIWVAKQVLSKGVKLNMEAGTFSCDQRKKNIDPPSPTHIPVHVTNICQPHSVTGPMAVVGSLFILSLTAT